MIPAPLLRLLLACGLAALLGSCGGGVGSGGTGDMAGGYGAGTITGFGSVFVDGERYDDSGARIEYDTEAGTLDVAQARPLALGQRVELEFETEGPARRVRALRITPALIGPVTSLSPLKVAGQRVSVNDEAARGPMTRFGPGLEARQFRVGQRLEVHGVLAQDGIRATRIEEAAEPQDKWLRLRGIVSNFDGRSFRLGALTVTLPEPGRRPAGLKDGQRVQVWTRQAVNGASVAADRIRIDRRPLAARQTVQLSGVADTCPDRDASAYVCVGGTAVALREAQLDDGLNAAALAQERPYVIVRGRYDDALDALGEARIARPDGTP